jgi:hypothetical protein
MTVISAPCPTCGEILEFTRSERYGRVAASCRRCGEDYGLSPAGIGRIGSTPSPAAPASPLTCAV